MSTLFAFYRPFPQGWALTQGKVGEGIRDLEWDGEAELCMNCEKAVYGLPMLTDERERENEK